MQKNEIYTVICEDITSQGYGVVHLDSMAVFVVGLLPKEKAKIRIVKVLSRYAFGKIEERYTSSCDRLEPACLAFGKCGGCAFLHLDYLASLKVKQNAVQTLFDRAHLPIQVEFPLSVQNPYTYRNKAQFPVGRGRDGRLITGFYAGRTHSIIENRDCLLGVKENETVLNTVLSFAQEKGIDAYDEKTKQGLLRHVLIRKGFATGQIMVCLVLNGPRLPEEEVLADRLFAAVPGMTSFSVNINREATNVILGEKTRLIRGKERIEDQIGGLTFSISPRSFYQVNPVQTERIYAQALEYAGLTGQETVWDLYCGIGTISLFLAREAKDVYGVEIVPEAIDDAKKNAERNGISNAHFYVGKAEEVLPQKYEAEGISADVIVVDPPRKGCDEACLSTMVRMRPERIVYVSCDSATLARDLKYLAGNGYEVVKGRAIDNFPGGVHVETVALLSHKSPDGVINVKVEFGEGDDKISLDAIAERAKKYQPKPKITYKMIQEYVEKKYGFKVHTAYIAEVKRALGLTMFDAPNAAEELKQPRKHPPKEKAEAIVEALKHFEVI